jgi:hypothetical protein
VEEAREAALEVAQEEITTPKGLSQARQAVTIRVRQAED